ncbi:hypothetical protein SpCBS45565_g08019 [Spizellomyces sp. 'palustris']|nr:hypothetical protein SpCBS45565_g08019 [Spizellomyces sp. 'palustris']
MLGAFLLAIVSGLPVIVAQFLPDLHYTNQTSPYLLGNGSFILNNSTNPFREANNTVYNRIPPELVPANNGQPIPKTFWDEYFHWAHRNKLPDYQPALNFRVRGKIRYGEYCWPCPYTIQKKYCSDKCPPPFREDRRSLTEFVVYKYPLPSDPESMATGFVIDQRWPVMEECNQCVREKETVIPEVTACLKCLDYYSSSSQNISQNIWPFNPFRDFPRLINQPVVVDNHYRNVCNRTTINATCLIQSLNYDGFYHLDEKNSLPSVFSVANLLAKICQMVLQRTRTFFRPTFALQFQETRERAMVDQKLICRNSSFGDRNSVCALLAHFSIPPGGSPVDPGPAEPSNPSNPTNPGHREPNPNDPGTGNPSNPSNPETGIPGNPSNPGTGIPGNPSNTGPGIPGNPSNPGPGIPGNPSNSGTGIPGNPSNPESGNPILPVGSGSAVPVLPGQILPLIGVIPDNSGGYGYNAPFSTQPPSAGAGTGVVTGQGNTEPSIANPVSNGPERPSSSSQSVPSGGGANTSGSSPSTGDQSGPQTGKKTPVGSAAIALRIGHVWLASLIAAAASHVLH